MLEPSRISIRKETCLLAVLAFTLCFTLALFTTVPMLDVARYGNMVRSFLDGDWEHVLHPRISPLLPLLGGAAAWITRLESYRALQLVSSLFFAAAVFPLSGIFHVLFPRRAAWIALLMSIFASTPMRYGASGMRDSMKGFFYILCVWLLIEIFRKRENWKRYLLLGAASALLALTRSEGTAFACCFIAAAMMFDLGKFRIPWRSAISLAACLAVMTPWLLYMRAETGYPVPDIRYIPILKQIIRSTGGSSSLTPAAIVTPRQKRNVIRELSNDSSLRKRSHYDGLYKNFFYDLFDSFYPEFGIMALLGIAVRLLKKRWSREETILLCALILHTVLLIAQIRISDHYWYVSRRYLLPVTALEFGWAGWFAVWLWDKIEYYLPILGRWHFAMIAVCSTAIGLHVHAYNRVIKAHSSRSKSLERIALRDISAHIRNDYKGPRTFPHTQIPLREFRTNRLPIVASPWHQMGYLSGGQTLNGNDIFFQSGGRIPDYIVIDTKTSEGTVFLKNGYRLNRTFRIKGRKIELYKFSGQQTKK